MKEEIITVYNIPEVVEGDPYIRIPREIDKAPATKRVDRETGKIITLWDEKLKYPYKTTIKYIFIIKTNKYTYEFPLYLENGEYIWNGSNIPSIFWSVLNISKNSPEGLIASLAHDNFLQFKQHFFNLAKTFNEDLTITEFRFLTTKIYEQLLINCGVSKFKANLMGLFINIYQFFNADWKEIY